MDRVMRLKPAKHGKRLDGKRVIIADIHDLIWRDRGVYMYKSKDSFAIIDNNSTRHYSCRHWIVGEIIEMEE